MDNIEEYYLIYLNSIRGFGPKTIHELYQKLKRISKLWKLKKKELKALNLNSKKINSFLNCKGDFNYYQLKKSLKEKNINFLTLYNSRYPKKLMNIYDPPPVIFYQGQLNFNLPAVAVIGSRKSTLYGRKIASKTSAALAAKGINIISGMANGIDSTAHKGALSVESGITTAVFANGFNYIYPSENNYLAKKIKKEGLLITEFNPEIPPKAGNFPRRNRIISALADLILVVEAGKKSGTLITVDYALEQGKDIMAVPANIDRPTGVGCNKLLKKGAAVFTEVQDILDYLNNYLQKERPNADFIQDRNELQKVYPELNYDEKKILYLFQYELEIYYDDLIRLSNLTTDKVDKILIKFELMDLIQRLKGKKYRFKGLQNLLKPI
ncbi:DNA-processing protein DprA [Halanaerobium hydrogeniformans]|uniref:DNA protecting protein DprA n=1 Tax=Halanaerobium hydrogeniformans TaxID=656519 RepID=E4RL13_HALHG|nr:DNA-processing protein DprA [Halanaerobium hydrogeniformans]ADQ14777.1 DNA protecting protein DprA [Halanaerobium hydrogeniformans]